MTKKRSNFDWSLLDRKDLVDYFYLLASEVSEKRISVPKFHKAITKHVKARLPVIITKKTEKTAKSSELYVGGTYYSYKDKSKQRCIELIFFYSLDKTITISRHQFKDLCTQMADTLLHEIIHMRQHRRRKFKVLPDYASTAESSTQRREQEYLGNSDEIDAYSFNIACALATKFKGNSKKAVQYLNQNRKSKTNWGWNMYMDAFDKNLSHPIIRRLRKKVIRYFPNALEGKPYRGKDWINR